MRKIKIRARHVELSDDLQAHVESRVGFALSRFGDRIGRVIVRLSNAREANASEHRCCEIAVDFGARIIWAEDTDADVFAAVDHAAQRASRSVARAIEQEHEFGKDAIRRPIRRAADSSSKN